MTTSVAVSVTIAIAPFAPFASVFRVVVAVLASTLVVAVLVAVVALVAAIATILGLGLLGVGIVCATLTLRSRAVSLALAVFVTILIAIFAAFFVVEAGDAILFGAVCRLLHLGGKLLTLKLLDLAAGTVGSHNLTNTRDGQRNQVRQRILAAAEGHRAGQNVALDEEELSVEGLQRLTNTGHITACICVGVVLVHQAALELRALTGQLLRVERDVLHASGIGRNAREARNPRCAAQLTATGADTANAASLLACANLLHLDTDVELLGKDLDKLAEVDTSLGDVVEDSLNLISLVLNVANLHIETHIGSNLT